MTPAERIERWAFLQDQKTLVLLRDTIRKALSAGTYKKPETLNAVELLIQEHYALSELQKRS